MTKDEIVQYKIYQLYKKLEPIAEAMGIDLKKTKDCKSQTTIFVPLVDADSLDSADCASIEILKELFNNEGVGDALELWPDNHVLQLSDEIARIIRSHMPNWNE